MEADGSAGSAPKPMADVVRDTGAAADTEVADICEDELDCLKAVYALNCFYCK